VRAFLYAPASGHGGQRLQGAAGRLFSISIRTHQPPPDVKSWTTFFTNKFEKGTKK